MLHLPAPPPEAQTLTHTLVNHIHRIIGEHNGWIPFSHYMELVLYTPGLGYYAAGSHKLGGKGDYTTAPELTPMFGRTLASQLAQLLPQTAGTIYEFGAGTGRLAADVLLELMRLDALPTRYTIVDLSADLIERQHETLSTYVPHLMDRIEWLTQLPNILDGIIIGNEVLDSMPCELIHWTPTPLQRGVASKNKGFVWEDRSITDPLLISLAQGHALQCNDYVSEISLTNLAFIYSIAERLARGAILLIDYGFCETEYYHPQRYMGTLLGHYRHHTIHDPFFLPGLMDLTCHVDFTAVARAGVDAGLVLVGYTTQAQFLLNNGIMSHLPPLDPNNSMHYLAATNAVQTLLSPAEMGELFKVIGFGKGISVDWAGFSNADRCHTL